MRRSSTLLTILLLSACTMRPGGGRDVLLGELLNADRAFARETARRGAEGWTERFAPDGNMGYTIGRYEARQRDTTGALVRSTGTYVTVWRKDARGGWKVALDIGNPDPQRS